MRKLLHGFGAEVLTRCTGWYFGRVDVEMCRRGLVEALFFLHLDSLWAAAAARFCSPAEVRPGAGSGRRTDGRVACVDGRESGRADPRSVRHGRAGRSCYSSRSLMCPGRQTDRRAGYVRKQTGRGDGDLCWTEQEEAPGCCSSRSGLLLWQILLDRHRYPCPRPACPSVCLSVCRDTSNSRQAEHQTRHRARGRLMYSVPPQRQRLLRVSIRLL